MVAFEEGILASIDFYTRSEEMFIPICEIVNVFLIHFPALNQALFIFNENT